MNIKYYNILCNLRSFVVYRYLYVLYRIFNLHPLSAESIISYCHIILVQKSEKDEPFSSQVPVFVLVKADFNYTCKPKSKGNWKRGRLPSNMITVAIVDRNKSHHEI